MAAESSIDFDAFTLDCSDSGYESDDDVSDNPRSKNSRRGNIHSSSTSENGSMNHTTAQTIAQTTGSNGQMFDHHGGRTDLPDSLLADASITSGSPRVFLTEEQFQRLIQSDKQINIQNVVVNDSRGVQVNIPKTPSSTQFSDVSAASHDSFTMVNRFVGESDEGDVHCLLRNMRVHSEKILQEHHRTHTYVRTRAFNATLARIEGRLHDGRGAFVIIVGGSGYGLTSFGNEVMFAISMGELGPKRTVSFINLPKVFPYCANVQDKSAVYIDDMFGRGGFDPVVFKKWRDMLPTISDCTSLGNAIIVTSINKHVFESVRDRLKRDKNLELFCEDNVIDLTSEEFRCNWNENKKILEEMLKDSPDHVGKKDLLKFIDISMAPYGFPKYALEYAKVPLSIAKPVFMSIQPCLFHDIDGLYQSSETLEKEKYIALAAVYLNRGPLDVLDLPMSPALANHQVREGRKLAIGCSPFPKRHAKHDIGMNYLVDVALKIGLPPLNRGGILRGASCLNGSLLSSSDKVTFGFAGKSIQNAVALSIGKFFPKFVAETADCFFLYNYVQPSSFDPVARKKSINALEIEEHEEIVIRKIFERLEKAAMADGLVKSFAEHPFLGRTVFVSYFMKSKSKADLRRLLSSLDKETSHSLLYHSLIHPSDVTEHFIKNAKWTKFLIKTMPFRYPILECKALRKETLDVILKACDMKREEVFKLLRVVIRHDDTWTACIKRACRSGCEGIVTDILCLKDFNSECLSRAFVEACQGYAEKSEYQPRSFKIIIESLLRRSVDINARHMTGQETVLHWASRYNHVKVIKPLLEYDADIQSVDSEGEGTPLHVAVMHSSTEVSEVLLDKGASVSEADKKGRLPIHIAAEKNQGYICALLLRYKSPVDIADKKGRVPLDIACKANSNSVVDVLRDHKD